MLIDVKSHGRNLGGGREKDMGAKCLSNNFLPNNIYYNILLNTA